MVCDCGRLRGGKVRMQEESDSENREENGEW